jgi:hypothetical protein
MSFSDARLQKVHDLEIALANNGIFAMYGGRKGHGFWLYRSSPAVATSLVNQFDPAYFNESTFPIIKNDGAKSGNPCFWMFADAMRLVKEQNVTSI